MRHSSIVAISNGRSVLRYELGERIDCYEEVVRFNAAQVSEQFQRHVGIKTTIWSHGSTENSQTRWSDFRHCRRIMTIPDLPGKENLLAPKNVECIPREFERRLRKEANIEPGKWCTTGMITLAWLLREFEQIHTVGWLEDKAASDEKVFLTHYFEPPQKETCNHDIPKEERQFQKWVETGRIVPIS
jgi:hypothetical protein